MTLRIDKLNRALREFSQEASGVLFWTGFLMGLLLGLSISVLTLLYFNFKVMI